MFHAKNYHKYIYGKFVSVKHIISVIWVFLMMLLMHKIHQLGNTAYLHIVYNRPERALRQQESVWHPSELKGQS